MANAQHLMALKTAKIDFKDAPPQASLFLYVFCGVLVEYGMGLSESDNRSGFKHVWDKT